MTSVTKVTTVRRVTRRRAVPSWRKHWRRILIIVPVVIAIGVLAGWRLSSIPPAPTEPPEAEKVLQLQEGLHFGILIPAYLPRGFDRAGVDIVVDNNGPAGEPQVTMVYKNTKGAAIFLHQWVPANPELETLANSRPIETAWGKGWLLTQAQSMSALWVDLGILRVSVSTASLNVVSREQLVLTANTLGLASNLQAYSFYTALPVIKGIDPPPPFEVKLNDQGVQELNLVITPGGYSPMRFAVKKGIPVKINFRAMGDVGCGNLLLFPIESGKDVALRLDSRNDVKVLEFTPQSTGDFQFQCTNNCFRGIMTVRGTG